MDKRNGTQSIPKPSKDAKTKVLKVPTRLESSDTCVAIVPTLLGSSGARVAIIPTLLGSSGARVSIVPTLLGSQALVYPSSQKFFVCLVPTLLRGNAFFDVSRPEKE